MGRQNPVEGLPPRWVRVGGEETSHPHGLEGGNLIRGINKTDTAEPGRSPTHVLSWFKGRLSGPHRLPGQIGNSPESGGGRGRQTTLVPEQAKNLAVDEEGAALKSTRPVTKLEGGNPEPRD